jgi:hypothetical protein
MLLGNVTWLHSLKNLGICSGKATRFDEWAAKNTFSFKEERPRGGNA